MEVPTKAVSVTSFSRRRLPGCPPRPWGQTNPNQNPAGLLFQLCYFSSCVSFGIYFSTSGHRFLICKLTNERILLVKGQKKTSSDYQTLSREGRIETGTNKNYPSLSLWQASVPLRLPSFHTRFPAVAQFPLGSRLFSTHGFCGMVTADTHRQCGSQSTGLPPPHAQVLWYRWRGPYYLSSVISILSIRTLEPWGIIRLEVSCGSRNVSMIQVMLGSLAIPNSGAFNLLNPQNPSNQPYQYETNILCQRCSDQ